MSFDKERFREAMGNITAIELADRLGCPKSSISMYLNGQREPSKMAVQLIALNLGVNPAWLSGVDVPKYENAKIISRSKSGLYDSLTEEEQHLLELWKKADSIDKQTIWNILSRYDKKDTIFSAV